ncbi:phosphoenolpyruvate hydrolase family protein [Bombilactobacillus apium]|uniref:phosphoenolpyruvate hydrolase family protein n=1 Tax=Bombilactobacillus apium TaxID=2675299 RepID=UPI00226BC0D3|nr:phosphoenolpyruvate hydrolase family protein [Bombilactobacillus apium]
MATELLAKLQHQRFLGKHLLGLSTATGMNLSAAMTAGIDLILLLNSGKFRQMGRSSLGGYLPFTNANHQIAAIAKEELLPLTPKVPLILGIH